MSDNRPHAEIWNIRDGGEVLVDAQNRLNVVGRVIHHAALRKMTWSLNGGEPRDVYVQGAECKALRLARPGEFNIEQIHRGELLDSNRLDLALSARDGRVYTQSVRFNVRAMPGDASDPPAPQLSMNLRPGVSAGEVGQVVDGNWRVNRAADGRLCLEIVPEDNGLDRIVLFGHDEMTTGYTVRARLRVTRWIRKPCNVGLLFHWNPHLQGDGSSLPSTWSTGLAYFYSNCSGLRIRVGIDVHTDESGVKRGDNVLAEAPLSRARAAADRAAGFLAKYSRRRFRPGVRFVQLPPGVDYCFEFAAARSRYALTVWRAGGRKPRPQVVVPDPPLLLGKGSVGVIAHRCGVQVYEFEVEPDE